jgi:hypothetical protein
MDATFPAPAMPLPNLALMYAKPAEADVGRVAKLVGQDTSPQ